MKKCSYRLLYTVMALVIMISVITFTETVKAEEAASEETSQLIKSSKSMSTARKTEPEEWNRREVNIYKFADLEDAVKYMVTGGIKYYNKTYFSAPYKIKMNILESGTLYLTMGADNERKSVLYDRNMKYIQRIPEEGLVKVNVQAGDCFYVEFPANAKEGLLTAYVLENEFKTLKEENINIQRVTGSWTEHSFYIKKRSCAEMAMLLVNPSGGKIEAYVEKKEKGVWKKIGKRLTVSGEGIDTTYGLAPGNYRLMLKTNENQGAMVIYDRKTVSKKVAYRRKKAKTIKVGKSKFNLYTTGEKASRWYRVSVKTKKKRRKVEFTTTANQGGFRFTIYQKGKKKPYKVKKVSGDRSVTVKLPKKYADYQIKVSKISKRTNGTYRVSYK